MPYFAAMLPKISLAWPMSPALPVPPASARTVRWPSRIGCGPTAPRSWPCTRTRPAPPCPVAGQEEQVTEGIGDGGRDGGEGGSGVGPGGRSEDNGGSGGGGHGDAASAGRYAAPLPSAAARHPSRLTLPERWGRNVRRSRSGEERGIGGRRVRPCLDGTKTSKFLSHRMFEN
ncbi:hypothetical protein DAI22_06g261200 [Oryza sativa Japonica Group]|nr:hypothetical protein DAI22_06g261200 [Oryza sativa Japonica Group]